MKASSRGYTILEVLVILALMGILMAVSLPAFLRWLPSYRLQSAATTMANHLRAARLLAILKGKNHQVQVKVANEGNYYQVVEDPEGDDRIVISIGRVILDKEFGGVILSATNFENGTLTFFPRGISDNGRIWLNNARDDQIEIVIFGGRVRIE